MKTFRFRRRESSWTRFVQQSPAGTNGRSSNISSSSSRFRWVGSVRQLRRSLDGASRPYPATDLTTWHLKVFVSIVTRYHSRWPIVIGRVFKGIAVKSTSPGHQQKVDDGKLAGIQLPSPDETIEIFSYDRINTE